MGIDEQECELCKGTGYLYQIAVAEITNIEKGVVIVDTILRRFKTNKICSCYIGERIKEAKKHNRKYCTLCQEIYRNSEMTEIDITGEETINLEKLEICIYCKETIDILEKNEYNNNTIEALEDIHYDIDIFIGENFHLLKQDKISKIMKWIDEAIAEKER